MLIENGHFSLHLRHAGPQVRRPRPDGPAIFLIQPGLTLRELTSAEAMLTEKTPGLIFSLNLSHSRSSHDHATALMRSDTGDVVVDGDVDDGAVVVNWKHVEPLLTVMI